MTSTSAEPDVNIHETRVPAVASVVTVLTALSILCVSLRFWVRRTRRGGLWIDDWLILLGMVLSVAVSLIMLRRKSFSIQMTPNSMGVLHETEHANILTLPPS